MQKLLNELKKEGYEKRAELLALSVDEYDEDLFIETVDEAYQMAKEGSKAYDERCKSEKAPEKITSFEDIYEIPLVDMAEFKDKSQSDTLRTQKNDWGYVYTSGTSKNVRGKIPVSRLGMEVRKNISERITNSRYPNLTGFAVISIDPILLKKAPEEITNRYIFNILPSYYEQFDAEYFIGFKDGKPNIKMEELISYLKKNAKGISGVPSKLLPIFNYIEGNNIEIDFGKNGCIATGGGWKGTEGITNKTFRKKTSNVLNINVKNHIDHYAASELTGFFSNKFGDDNPDLKRVPSQYHTIIINKDKFLEEGKIDSKEKGEGLLGIIDPLNIDIPGFILTDDVVRKTGGEYGKDVRVEYIGRSSM